MKRWNLTLIAGLAGVVHFFLMALLFAVPEAGVIYQVTLILVTAVAVAAVVSNIRERSRNRQSWHTWAGLVGALLMAIPGISLLIASFMLVGGSADPDGNGVLALFSSLSAIGLIYFLPIGTALCLIAGFGRFHRSARGSES